MATTIKIKNSAIPGNTPPSLEQGEMALNVTDGRLFYGSGSGDDVKEFTGTIIDTGSFATTGSNTFIGNQVISGNLDISGSIDVTNINGTFQQITGITVTSQSWGLTGSIYSSSISNANITANTAVDVIPDNEDYTIVLAAQLLPKNISSNGEVTIFSVNEPTDDIGVTLNLFK